MAETETAEELAERTAIARATFYYGGPNDLPVRGRNIARAAQRNGWEVTVGVSVGREVAIRKVRIEGDALAGTDLGKSKVRKTRDVPEQVTINVVGLRLRRRRHLDEFTDEVVGIWHNGAFSTCIVRYPQWRLATETELREWALSPDDIVPRYAGEHGQPAGTKSRPRPPRQV